MRKDNRKIHFYHYGKIVCGQEGGRSAGGAPMSRAGYPMLKTEVFKNVTCGLCINVVQGPPGRPPQYVRGSA